MAPRARWAERAGALAADPVERVAQVCLARRPLLLRVHRHRLRMEDLEDAYSQATLELLLYVGRGGRFSDSRHLARAVEVRFLSRIQDRRRALSGRSTRQALLEEAVALDGEDGARFQIADRRADPVRLAIARDELGELARQMSRLTRDQRRVLASQAGGETCADACARLGWSAEKYRKVAQRGRARLRELMEPPRSASVPSPAGRSEEPSGPTSDE